MRTGEITLIARREVVTRLQQKGYRIGFLAALALVIIGCIVPSLFNGDDSATHYDVGVAVNSPGLPSALRGVARTQGDRVTVHRATAREARAKVKAGDWDAAVLPHQRLVTQHADDAVVDIVQAGAQLGRTVTRLRDAGLTIAQIKKALQSAPLQVESTESSGNSQRQAIAIITVVALFTQLIMFCTWVAMGVVEEKASRVVELVLSSVRPVQLLAGKLLGIGVLAATQVAVLGGAALATASASGLITIPVSALVTVLISFVDFVLAYGFFAALAAALGSTVSRQEEVSGVLAPVTMTLTVCYVAGFAAANKPDAGFTRVLSILPPISSIAMPARIARGGVPALDIVLAIVLLLAAAAGILAVAARIYRASILHSGTRVSLRRAWRGEPVADLA